MGSAAPLCKKNTLATETTTNTLHSTGGVDNVHHQIDINQNDEAMTEVNESPPWEVHLLKNYILSAKAITKFGTWNVRTAFQCSKINQIIKEMKNFQI